MYSNLPAGVTPDTFDTEYDYMDIISVSVIESHDDQSEIEIEFTYDGGTGQCLTLIDSEPDQLQNEELKDIVFESGCLSELEY